jgi:hypothetical protein
MTRAIMRMVVNMIIIFYVPSKEEALGSKEE